MGRTIRNGEPRILHLTTAREITAGQRKQLTSEHLAAQSLRSASWTVIAIHTKPPMSDFERQAPRLFRNALLVRLYGWLYLIARARRFDHVLQRATTVDPFGPLLGWFVRNRSTVHHAKELEELPLLKQPKLLRRWAVFLERFATPVTMRSARGIFGVTHEIAQYEAERFPWLASAVGVFPNGIIVDDEPMAEDAADIQHDVRAVFVAGSFASWHGLDRLIAAIEFDPDAARELEIHLAGKLSDTQRRQIEASEGSFVLHGTLGQQELDELLGSADVAIGSLALDREHLSEGCTLKVREYLNAGLPIYATHVDSALPSTFEYFYADTAGVSLRRLKDFADDVREVDRTDVREAARTYIDKRHILARVASVIAG